MTTNIAPVVDAGPDVSTLSLGAAVTLNGVVMDDGLPTGVGVVTSWTQASGPGTASFTDASKPATTVTFDQAGIYVLKLTADDSLLRSSDLVEVRVGASTSERLMCKLWWQPTTQWRSARWGRYKREECVYRLT